MIPTPIKVWALPVRIIHWTLVSAVVIAWIYAGSELDIMWHVYAGFTAGIAIIIKWIYGNIVRDFSSFKRFPPNPPAAGAYLIDLFKGNAKRYLGHNPAGALAIYAMLSLGSSTVTSGFLAYEQVNLFFDWDNWKIIHNFLAYTWLCVIIVHVGGVIIGSAMHKENLIWSMVTGNKRRRLFCTDSKEITGKPMPTHICHIDDIPNNAVTETMRLRYIEEAAYYLAEKRGWTNGCDWEDWHIAEKQIDAMLKK